MNAVVLGLGSNRQLESGGGVLPPCEILKEACAKLDKLLKQAVFSSVYITRPMYVENQCDFYNMVVGGLWSGSARELLLQTQAIEAEFGRDRSREIRNGPRSLDIDIEIFGNGTVNEPDLVIPHPRLMERSFVLVPLLEILEKSADKTERDSDAFYVAADALIWDVVAFRKAQESLPDQGVRYYGRIYGENR
ncbi:MAG: 2-amino-4-hydroxy-6-hydroxymethyldihydropteridine diphosphokinase [Treponemataceae bacterium]|nr:2-amino-4-hydroxy-6-hydroxymethyldihydropteridine diphosphokinase [Treponemataceae bacterium]